jgi:ABC-2 type transport system ATP-binding protein
LREIASSRAPLNGGTDMSEGGNAPAIVAEGVSKKYRAFTAVDRLDLSVRRGEVFCLFGPNGSGKTTFLRMLTGYISPSAGRLSVAGHDVVHDPLAAKRKIGYVPEAVPLYDHMRVGEFLRFMARLHGVAAEAVEDAVVRVVTRLALADVVEKPVRVLSRGFRQRTALAQALVHDPEIIVLDEPTNGLDPRQIIEMRSLIRALAGERTVLMSSHILSEIEKTADRAGLLLDGRLLGVREIRDGADLEAWFLSVT